MKNLRARARVARRAAQAACLGILLSVGPLVWAHGFQQHGGHPAPAPHASQPRPSAPHGQPRMQPQPRALQGRPQQPPRPAGNPGYGGRTQPVRPPSGYGPGSTPGNGPGSRPQNFPANRPGYGYPGSPVRPQYNGGTPYTMRPTPQAGHLPQWMEQHRNMSADQQERLLRQEPGFNRLNPHDQQREIQQLHRLDALPAAQRDRRLARAEELERLSPGERMQVNQSTRQYTSLPPDRQQLVRRAFRDLRGVPMEQRQMMLNSARYGATFSPEERGILSNLLRIEPYQPPQ